MLSRRGFVGLLSASAFPGLAWSAQPNIVATTGMIADAARVVSGLPVVALMGPGMDPHGHRPTRNDILSLSRADLILWHGLNLEAQFADLMADLANRSSVVAVAEALPKDGLLANPLHPDRPDPHIWFDPALWSDAVQHIEKALLPFAPTAPENAEMFRQSIAQMGAYAAEVLATVPTEKRILVTAHDAFSYFGRAFGFSVEGVQGISTESEAGLARIGELVDLLVERQIPAVFVETSVSDRSIRALIEGAAARGHRVTIGGELFSDAMGPDGSYEGTWLGMLDHNATTIAKALGGTAPERGKNGKLGLAG